METKNFYKLPPLSYDYNELEPYISKEQLSLHHLKHHEGYVNGLNTDFEKIQTSRKEGTMLDMRSILKEMSFNFGGHVLHTLYWNSLAPAKNAKKKPEGDLLRAMNNEFGSLERFMNEFTQTALSVEGSGWAALAYSKQAGRPIIMQIEKHNNNIFPAIKILFIIDVFEHAYYIDYKNERTKYIEAIWNIVNWEKVSSRYEMAKQ